MKTNSKQTVKQSILWAAAMIGTAILLRGNEASENVFLLLLVLATTSLLAQGAVKNELTCLKRMVASVANNKK
ncbi:hypothetical protein [Kordiimonas sp.]|uniref:hypothetical protein n=1 Tax=Kordiimonas sp. TaxID=1970157 RepID=UPI003A8E8003